MPWYFQSLQWQAARPISKAVQRRLIKKKVAEGHLSSIRVLSPSCKSKAPKRRQCPNHKFKAPTTSPKPGYKTKPQQEDSLKEKVAGGHLSPYELSAPATSPKPRREDKAPTTRPKLQLQVQRHKAPTTSPKPQLQVQSPGYKTKPQQEDPLKKRWPQATFLHTSSQLHLQVQRPEEKTRSQLQVHSLNFKSKAPARKQSHNKKTH